MTVRLAEPVTLEQLEELNGLLRGTSIADSRLPALTNNTPPGYPWHQPKLQAQAHRLHRQTVKALRIGDKQQATANWLQIQGIVHADQQAWALHISREHHVPLANLGQGPMPKTPVMHREPRCDWRVYPVDARHGIHLPSRARDIKATWERDGSPFASYYLADEIPTPGGPLNRTATYRAGSAAAALAKNSAHAAADLGKALIAPLAAAAAAVALIDPILIGIISTNATTGDWYALERWNHH